MSKLAARQSAFGTAIQVLPRLKQVVEQMRPTWHLCSLRDLDAAFVARHQIGALVWDVDGTLTVHHAQEVAPHCREAFQVLRQLPRLRHAILSNASEPRFRDLSGIFPGIPIYKGYQVDGALTLRTRLDNSDSWNPDEVEARLQDGVIPVRKPSGELVEKVIEALALPAAQVVMVGDQYLTDVAGAGLAGIRSIKLPSFGRADFPLLVQLSQRAEQILYRLKYGAPTCEGAPSTHAAAEEHR